MFYSSSLRVVKHLSILCVLVWTNLSGLVPAFSAELKYLFMAAKRGKVKARDLICISSQSTAFRFPPAKQDYLITHPLNTLSDYVFFFCPDSSHSTSSALPHRHLTLCLSLSLLLQAGGVTCQLTLPQAEEFIPESGTRPYWGKVRGLGGNHPM